MDLIAHAHSQLSQQDFVLLTLFAVVCIYVLPKRVYRWMRSKPVEGKAKKDA